MATRKYRVHSVGMPIYKRIYREVHIPLVISKKLLMYIILSEKQAVGLAFEILRDAQQDLLEEVLKEQKR